jgi:glycosyltransferase involved in cell wall biosynthesis
MEAEIGAAKSGPIGFLVKVFPKVSETFILGEILGLEHCHLPILVFSLNRPTEHVEQRVRAPVIYIPRAEGCEALQVLKAHLTLILRRPRRYLSALAFAWSRPEGGTLMDFVLAGSLAEQMKRLGIVHLHAHYASQPAAVAELVERLTGIPFSISAHAKDIYLSQPESLRRKLARARFTVTCTQYNKEYLDQVTDHRAVIYRMYHGINLDRFRRGSETAARLRNGLAPLVLTVGRLREKKGLPVLIEACRRLREAGMTLCCQIVGYGPEQARLQALVAQWGLGDRVQFLGKLGQDEVIQRYLAADIFVLPCQVASDGDRDGIPNVLLEAMALELPVISTTVSGIPEVIRHGENGLLVPPGDAPALAAAIQSLIDQPVLGARLGRAARLTVAKQFSHAANLQLLYDLLMGARGIGAEAPFGPRFQPHLEGCQAGHGHGAHL